MSEQHRGHYPPVLRGTRATLRPLQPSDKQDRLAIGRHAEFVRMNGGDSRNLAPLTTEEVDWWYARLASQRFAWAIDLAGRGIGVARLTHVDEASRRMDYAIGILAPDLWNQGLGTEATRLVLRFAFDELRLHRVGLLVLDINERAQAMYEKCGFVREGVVREGVLVGDEWHSDVTMSILEVEYRRASAQ